MKFSKMHSLGNDFMIVDGITQNISFSSEIIRYLSNRHLGIGFDQLLIVEPPHHENLDFHYRIFNADGGEVTQCGNGARCFARFVRMKNLTNKHNIYVSTKAGSMVLTITKDDMVRVNMGEPNFDPQKIPFYATKAKKTYILHANKQKFFCGVVSIGNPHCVITVDSVENVPILVIGPMLQQHKRFPKQTNIAFMQVLNRNCIRLRVYERGSGETMSCGSGACAAVAVGILQGQLAEQVQVNFPNGLLTINWRGIGHPLFMTGPATHIYDGFISL